MGEWPASASSGSTDHNKPQESSLPESKPQETSTPEGHSTDITGESYVKYTTLTGYFLQDEANTDANTFNYVRPLHKLKIISQSMLTCLGQIQFRSD